MTLHAGNRPGAWYDLQQVFIRHAFTVADAALAGFDSRERPRRCCPPSDRPLRLTPSPGSSTTGGGGIGTGGGISMTPSGLSPVVPAATVFAPTAQAAELASKSSIRGFMVIVEKLAEHACAACMVFGHRAFAGVGRRIVIVREIYTNDNIIIIG